MRPSVPGPTGTRIGRAGGLSGEPALQSIRRIHGHGADPVIAEMLFHFQDQRLLSGPFHLDRLEKLRELSLGKFHVHHTAKDLYNTASCVCHDSVPPDFPVTLFGRRPLLGQAQRNVTSKFSKTPSGLRQCFSAANDVQNVVRDRLLAHLVVLQLIRLGQFSRIIGCAVHGDHACRVLARL